MKQEFKVGDKVYPDEQMHKQFEIKAKFVKSLQ